MQEGVVAQKLNEHHSSEAQHGEAAVHTLGVGAPAEGRWIVSGGTGGLNSLRISGWWGCHFKKKE